MLTCNICFDKIFQSMYMAKGNQKIPSNINNFIKRNWDENTFIETCSAEYSNLTQTILQDSQSLKRM